ncbi:MAG: hypothetical protein IBX64_13160 [Actinobacteria bacterium]|nr:hypothetical protein [Actinomycetota bacterium]
MDKVGFHKVNRFKKNRLIEIFLSCLQNVLRALRIRRLQAIHIGRITNNIPGIMSDGKFPFRLEPGESCEVRAWGMYELIGDVGNKRENELLFINAFFKDTEGRVHECEAPAKALTIDQMPPFRGMFQ